jgi:hypothetical protein
MPLLGSALISLFAKFYPQNINYMLAVRFLKGLCFEQVSVDSEMPILGQAPRS